MFMLIILRRWERRRKGNKSNPSGHIVFIQGRINVEEEEGEEKRRKRRRMRKNKVFMSRSSDDIFSTMPVFVTLRVCTAVRTVT